MQREQILPPLPEFDITNLRWEPFREGIEIARITHPDKRVNDAPATAFLRYRPGATLAYHVHVGWEYIFVLSGSQTDENGFHAAGKLVVNPPGSGHKIISETGCVVLAIWEKPVVFEAE